MNIKKLQKDRTTRKGWIRRLDKLVSEIVKLRDVKCIVCGTTQKITCGHLFTRAAYSTRWDLDNTFAQCLSCNFRHEYDPYPMFTSVELLKGKDYVDELYKKFVHAEPIKTWHLKEMYDQLLTVKKSLE